MKLTDTAIQNPITEGDIANFLANTPDFFERHAELLASVQLSSGHGSRAVSLQERQAVMLRDKIKALEMRLVDMIRNGQENGVIANKLQAWTRALLLTEQAADLPGVVASELQKQFLVPLAAIKVWGVDEALATRPFAGGASPDIQAFASALMVPYCGLKSEIKAQAEAVRWLDDATAVQSVALIALRPGAAPDAFGLLVLGSADKDRFQAGMGTDFLQRIGELASAALSRLRTQPA